jgi:hypothetical protein
VLARAPAEAPPESHDGVKPPPQAAETPAGRPGHPRGVPRPERAAAAVEKATPPPAKPAASSPWTQRMDAFLRRLEGDDGATGEVVMDLDAYLQEHRADLSGKYPAIHTLSRQVANGRAPTDDDRKNVKRALQELRQEGLKAP